METQFVALPWIPRSSRFELIEITRHNYRYAVKVSRASPLSRTHTHVHTCVFASFVSINLWQTSVFQTLCVWRSAQLSTDISIAPPFSPYLLFVACSWYSTFEVAASRNRASSRCRLFLARSGSSRRC